MPDPDSTFVQFGETPINQSPSPDDNPKTEPKNKKESEKETKVEGKRKKNVPAILITIFALIAIIALAWFCWGRDFVTEKVIEHEMNQQLEQIKSGDVSTIVDNTSQTDQFFSDYQIDKTEFFQAYFDGFDYSIDSIIVEGDHAVIQCTLTTKDVSSVVNSTLSKIFDLATLNNFFNNENSDVKVTIGNAILEGVKDTSDYSTTQVDINLDKVDGKWQPTNMDQVVSLVVVGGDATTWMQDTIQSTTDGIASIGSSITTFWNSLTGGTSSLTSGTGSSTGTSSSTGSSSMGTSTTGTGSTSGTSGSGSSSSTSSTSGTSSTGSVG